MDLACRRGFAPSFDESKRPLIARQVLQAILQAVGDRLRSPSVQLVDRYLDLKGAFPRATVVPNESSVGKPDRAQERRDVMGNAGRCAEAILVEMLGFEVGSSLRTRFPGSEQGSLRSDSTKVPATVDFSAAVITVIPTMEDRVRRQPRV